MKKLFLLLLFILIPTSVFSYNGYNNYNDVETLIILDLSSSMILGFEDRSRFDVELEVVNNLLDKYDDSEKLGLRIIGMAKPLELTSEIMFGITPESLCTLTSTPVPIEAGNKSRIGRKINTLFPLGNTPIELALRLSVENDFKSPDSFKHIILITDGSENCGGDACTYIRELMQVRNDIKIDVVAISLNTDDFPLYNCLTQYTGGKITTVDSVNDINFKPNKPNYTNQPLNNAAQAPNNLPVQNNTPFVNHNFTLKNHLFEIYE